MCVYVNPLVAKYKVDYVIGCHTTNQICRSAASRMKLSPKTNLMRLFVNETRCLSYMSGNGITSSSQSCTHGWNCNNPNCIHFSNNNNNSSTTRLNKNYFCTNQQRDTINANANGDDSEHDDQDKDQSENDNNINDNEEEQVSESDGDGADSKLEARV